MVSSSAHSSPVTIEPGSERLPVSSPSALVPYIGSAWANGATAKARMMTPRTGMILLKMASFNLQLSMNPRKLMLNAITMPIAFGPTGLNSVIIWYVITYIPRTPRLQIAARRLRELFRHKREHGTYLLFNQRNSVDPCV